MKWLFAVATMIVLATPAHAQSTYTWQVTRNPGPANAGCGFTWTWQHADGSTQSGGFGGCASSASSGTGTVPPTATAIIVDGGISAGPGGCDDSQTVIKPAKTDLSVTTNVSIPNPVSGAKSGYRYKVKCPSGSATFSLQT